ncbi:pseudouridine synthase, partial [Tribonema minus]
MAVGEDGQGKASATAVTVLRRGTLALQGHPRKGERAALLLLRPSSGRRHQLRVHCKLLGHPIVGDATYADDAIAYRMFLHAARLTLPLPSVTYDISCPADFDHAL